MFQDASNSLPAAWHKAKVERVTVARILYVRDGRNAWHSTWVQRYYPSSFHDEWAKAVEFAESQRVQGSVFSIRQLPVLRFQTAMGSLLVGELNTTTPMKEYAPPLSISQAKRRARNCTYWFREYQLSEQLKRRAALKLPAAGWSLIDVFQSFADNAIAWRTPENRRTVVRLATEADLDWAELKPRSKLKSWRSYSNGGAYPLGWAEGDGIRHSAMWRIARQSADTAGSTEVRSESREESSSVTNTTGHARH